MGIFHQRFQNVPPSLHWLTGHKVLYSFYQFMEGVFYVKETVIDTKREEAMKRFALIAPLLEEGVPASELSQRRCLLLARGEMSERTLRRWIASYKKDGFNGLIRQERSDKGGSKRITQDALELAEEMRRELPRRSAGLICELLEQEGHKVARSTLERHLRIRGLSCKELTIAAKAGGATRRFVRVGRNTLWQSDIKFGPYIPDSKNPEKKQRTYLLVIIDDATRFVVHAEFYTSQKQPILEDGLRKAILRFGAPKSIYVDNGKIFTSEWIKLACAQLNIRHLRSRPFSPESKGKVERFNRTVESFLAELSLQKAQNLEELNQYFEAWLSEGYNNKPHSALNEHTPAEVFSSDTAPLRFHGIETLRDAFLHEAERVTDKTGCLNLDGKLYDAGAEWVRKKVTVRFDPFNLEEIQLWYRGEQKKVIREAQIGEHNSTQKVECEKVEKSGESRVLKVFAKQHQERFKKIAGAFHLIGGDE
jgi:transposase InsO family protein